MDDWTLLTGRCLLFTVHSGNIMTQYDALIIGGGHNGLVAAATLAKSGRKVLLLEKREVLGGAAATEPLFPGFAINTGAGDAGLLADEIVKELHLKMHGLEFRESQAAIFAPQLNGEALTLWRDTGKAAAEITRFSPRDAERYPAFVAQVNQFGGILRQMFLQTPPDPYERNLNDLMGWGKVALNLRLLGDRPMMEFMRVLPLSIKDYLDDWFESDVLKGALAGDGLTGLMQGPYSGGTTLMFLYQHSNGYMNRRTVVGGMGQLAAALTSAAQTNGAEIRTGVGVRRILVEENIAVGAELDNGERLQAQVILSNADPRRTFFELVGPQQLEPRFMRQVRNIIYRGSTARLHLALNGLPQFVGQIEEGQVRGRVVISPSVRYLEKAYDNAKYGQFSEQPYLDITIPSLNDPTLAPAGQHILSITMKYAPYRLRGTEWSEQKNVLAAHIINTLEPYAPGLRDLILHQHLITPLDWEQTYSLTEGNMMHGQMTIDQLLVMRPVPGWSQYRTPIDNLYLCGAGSHPGGGVTGVPGYNAARAVLKG